MPLRIDHNSVAGDALASTLPARSEADERTRKAREQDRAGDAAAISAAGRLRTAATLEVEQLNSGAEAEALVAKLLGKTDAGSALVRSAGTLDAARVRALLVD